MLLKLVLIELCQTKEQANDMYICKTDIDIVLCQIKEQAKQMTHTVQTRIDMTMLNHGNI